MRFCGKVIVRDFSFFCATVLAQERCFRAWLPRQGKDAQFSSLLLDKAESCELQPTTKRHSKDTELSWKTHGYRQRLSLLASVPDL